MSRRRSIRPEPRPFRPLPVGLVAAIVSLAGACAPQQERGNHVQESEVSALAGPAGFSSSGTGTIAGRPTSEFYPLVIGNRWEYITHVRLQLVAASGPQAPVEFDQPRRERVVGTSSIDGREYFLVATRDTTLPPDVPEYAEAWRQDRSGLFARDALVGPVAEAMRASVPGASLPTLVAAAIDRVARGPGERLAYQLAAERLMTRVYLLHSALANARVAGAAPHEFQELAYPIHVGKTWPLLDSTHQIRTVVAFESFVTPAGTFPAWRLVLRDDLSSTNDRLEVWYGREGVLGIRIHTEQDVPDPQGHGTLGRMVNDAEESLVGLVRVPGGR